MEYLQSDENTIGIDEVGRGTLFGDVVSAAVILPSKFPDDIYKQIKDSKKLSFKKREFLANYIKEHAITYGIGTASPEEIDEINILQATMRAMNRALNEAYKKKEFNKIIAITRSDKGSLAIKNNEIINCESVKVNKVLDLTGAGDLFAAGFLKEYLDKSDIKKCLTTGSITASKIIQKIGARLE